MDSKEEKIKQLAEFKKKLTLLMNEHHLYIYQIDEIYVGVNIIGKAIEDYITKHEKTYNKDNIINFADWIRNNPYVWQRPGMLNDQRTIEELFEVWEKDNIK